MGIIVRNIQIIHSNDMTLSKHEPLPFP